jgi:hypothetical protein
MALMQRAHGRHKRHAFARAPPLGDGLAQVCDGAGDEGRVHGFLM